MPSAAPAPRRFACHVAVVLAAAAAVPSHARADGGWLPTSWFSAHGADAAAMFPLAEKDGPWLVLATTFRGETAREDARRLVHELRDRFGLQAYTHEKAFDYTGRQAGVGLNPDGTPKTMRYANAKQVVEVAVLVGDFASCEDPRGQKTLQKVKTLAPESLGGEHAKGGLVSDFLQANRDHLAKAGGTKKPPMHTAMMIPNPLLPADFFTRQEVDAFVMEMNADVEHGLLDCPGRYTVRVATFSGAGSFDVPGGQSAARPGTASDPARLLEWLRGSGWRDPHLRGVAGEGRLVEAADKAHRLTEALRRAGWQAWEFHDRDSSLVCVGSIETLAVPQGDGRSVVNPEITRIVAALGPDPAALARGQVVPREFGGIMLDVQPKPIDVPRAPTRRR
ncbi:MAG: hypothetical protein ACKOSQ_06350 [Planctomycetaceae bacterium]